MGASKAPEPEAQGDLVQIPDGLYDGTYSFHETQRCFREGKLVIHFKIITPGPAFDAVIPAYFRVRMLPKNAGFSCGRHSKLARDWRLLFGRGADRWDRLPLTAMKGVIVRFTSRTVTKDFDQLELKAVNQYSVVDQIACRVHVNV